MILGVCPAEALPSYLQETASLPADTDRPGKPWPSPARTKRGAHGHEANALLCPLCRDDVAVSLASSLHVGGYLIVRDPFVPPAERLPSGILNDGQLVIVSGKAPGSIQAGEPGDGREHDFPAVIPAQKPGPAEAIDRPQVLADLGFVVTLVVVSGRLRRPIRAISARSYAPHFARLWRRPGRQHSHPRPEPQPPGRPDDRRQEPWPGTASL